MALAKQKIDVKFTSGMDRSTDEFLAVKPSLLSNCAWDYVSDANGNTRSALCKTGGYQATGGYTSLDGNTFASAKRLATRKDELLLESASALFSVARGVGYHRVSNNFVRTAATVKDLWRPGQDLTYSCPRAVRSNGFSCWVFQNGVAAPNVTWYVSVIDETSGAIILDRAVLVSDVTTSCPVIVATSTQFVIISRRASDTSIGYQTISYNAPATLSARTVWAADSAAAGYVAAIYSSSDNRIYFAYPSATGTIRRTNVAALTLATVLAGVGNANQDTQIVQTADTTIMLLQSSSANGVQVKAIPAALGAITGTANVAAAGAGYAGATLIETTTANRCMVVYSGTAATIGTTIGVLSAATVSTVPAVVSAAATVARGVEINSRAFIKDGHVYVAGTYPQAESPVRLVVGCGDSSGAAAARGVVARVLLDEAGSGIGNGLGIGEVFWDGAGAVITIPTLRQCETRVAAGSNYFTVGVSRFDLNFGPTSYPPTAPIQRTEFGSYTIFAGAHPLIFDGVGVFEAGINVAPDENQLTLTDSGVGVSTAGTYQVRIVYQFFDNNGRRWLSVPSVAKSIAVGAGRNIHIVAPTLRLTRAISPVYDRIRVFAYATEANGTVFYAAAIAYNDPTIDTVAMDIVTPDASLIGSEVLYTTGGALDYEPWPAHRVGCVHQNRYFMGGLEDPYAIQFTDELVENEAPATNFVYRLYVPSDKGKITGLCSMDDKLLIFCERGIWFVYGQGPDLAGTNGTYSTPQSAAGDFGCKTNSPDSIIKTPDGVWFLAAQGFRFLGRNLQVARQEDGTYLGAEVDELTLGTFGCVGAVPVPGKTHIRFYNWFSVFLYDYENSQWSTLTDPAGAADVVLQSGTTIVHIMPTGTMFESSGGWMHGASVFNMQVVTHWIRLDAINGFQRFYEAVLLGSDVSDSAQSALSVTIARDYDPNLQILSSGGVLATTPDAPFQLRMRPDIQKCSAIRFTISESAQGDDPGFTLTGMSLIIGVKKSLKKLPASSDVV
jgi:hypothetical protein